MFTLYFIIFVINKTYSDKITQSDFYYPFWKELEILENNKDDIVNNLFSNSKDLENQRWGDSSVGEFNYGVNQQLNNNNNNYNNSNSSIVKGRVIELGAGSLRKTSHLLRSLSVINRGKDYNGSAAINYFALDVDRDELQRTLEEIDKLNLDHSLSLNGLCGTYDMCFDWMNNRISEQSNNDNDNDDIEVNTSRKESTFSQVSSSPGDVVDTITNKNLPTPPSSPSPSDSNSNYNDDSPLSYWHLGSSIGNFGRDEAKLFLSTVKETLRPGIDNILIGIDGRNDFNLIKRAYDDEYNITRDFIMNGLNHASALLSPFNENQHKLKIPDFEYVSHYDQTLGRHEAYYKSKRELKLHVPILDEKDEITDQLKEITIKKDELINVEWSYKYSDKEALALFKSSGLRVKNKWSDKDNMYSLWLLERPSFDLRAPNLDGVGNLQGIPSVEDWIEMWKCWDTIKALVPDHMLMTKPIDLRHIVLFYFGHIPAFLDIHLSNILEESNTTPVEFKDIFERGIDPSIDDPLVCHSHSEVPQNDEDWPSVYSINDYDNRTRQRLLNVYADLKIGKRVLNRRLGRVLFMTFEHMIMHGETLLYMLIQKCDEINLPQGFTKPDFKKLSQVWNNQNESNYVITFNEPSVVKLGHQDFESQDLNEENNESNDQITKHEYGWDCENPQQKLIVPPFKIDSLPITNEEYLKFLQEHNSNHIPKSWHKKDNKLYIKTLYGIIDFEVGKKWPVIESLRNLNMFAKAKGGRIPTEPELKVLQKYISNDHELANVSFSNWHPIAPLNYKNDCKGHNGGVWEWSSSKFRPLDGFEGSKLYPGYSCDFYDDSHYIVVS